MIDQEYPDDLSQAKYGASPEHMSKTAEGRNPPPDSSRDRRDEEDDE